jgi:RNA polymerase sigma-70 factor (ECF subfamily)
MQIAAYDEGKALLARIAAGDRNAFSQFYVAHLNDLYRYIFLFTHSDEETQELLQEIFLKLWESREKLADLSSPRNYLLMVAKNKIIDNVRKLQIRKRVLAEIRRSSEAGESATGDDCAFREYYKVVQVAIDKLPPKRKLIFRLNIENGLSQEEIAQQLKISRSVVQKQLYKASLFVRKYLFEHGEISYILPFAFLFFSR